MYIKSDKTNRKNVIIKSIENSPILQPINIIGIILSILIFDGHLRDFLVGGGSCSAKKYVMVHLFFSDGFILARSGVSLNGKNKKGHAAFFSGVR